MCHILGFLKENVSELLLATGLYKKNQHGYAIYVNKWQIVADKINWLELHHHFGIKTKYTPSLLYGAHQLV